MTGQRVQSMLSEKSSKTGCREVIDAVLSCMARSQVCRSWKTVRALSTMYSSLRVQMLFQFPLLFQAYEKATLLTGMRDSPAADIISRRLLYHRAQGAWSDGLSILASEPVEVATSRTMYCRPRR